MTSLEYECHASSCFLYSFPSSHPPIFLFISSPFNSIKLHCIIMYHSGLFSIMFLIFFPACYYKTPDVLRLHGSLDIFSFILIFFCNMPHMWYFGLLRCYAMLISYKFGNVFFLFVMTFFSFLPLSSALFSLNCNWWVHINNTGFSISPCAACSVLSKSSLHSNPAGQL